MNYLSTVLWVLCALFCRAALAQTTPPLPAPRVEFEAAPPIYTQPLGIALESVPYPRPVSFLSLENGGQRVRMAYMDSPPVGTFPNFAARTPVLLLHGKNFYGAYWANTISALNAAGYRVIVPDQIGFGKSSKPDMAYSFDLLAANTIKLLDSLKIPKVSVVGHSMGGMLATKLALNYPNRVERLALEDPIGLEDYGAAIGPVADETLYQNEYAATGITNIRANFKNYFVNWKPEYENFVEVRSRVTLSGEWPRAAKASARTYQMILQQPIVGQLPMLQTPTLLVVGLSDRTAVGKNYASPAVAATLGNYPVLGKRAAQMIPHCQLLELNGVGHIPHLEAPEAFHRALIRFLQGEK